MDTEAGEQSSENDDDLAENDDDEDDKESADFVNPLLADGSDDEKSEKDGDEDQWSSDGERYDTRVVEPKEPGSKRVVGQKHAKPGTMEHLDNVKGFFKDTIELVPQTEIKRARTEEELPEGYSSMDSDDIAETRALAKKLLRKKDRLEAIESSYSNAFLNDDDEKALPSWFVEDEAKHNQPNINLTKEEVDEEKRILREWNARPSKKVMEAKARKKMRLARALNKIKNKA